MNQKNAVAPSLTGLAPETEGEMLAFWLRIFELVISKSREGNRDSHA